MNRLRYSRNFIYRGALSLDRHQIAVGGLDYWDWEMRISSPFPATLSQCGPLVDTTHSANA
jgi:hypothetical protein